VGKGEVLNDRPIERTETRGEKLAGQTPGKEGIKVQKVEPPKDFIRVMFPVSADNSPWGKKE